MRYAMHAGRVLAAVLAVVSFAVPASAADAPPMFEIQVIDDRTERGVPLVELETVNHLLFVTDSAGRAAIVEPGLMDREVFFHVRGHGYEYPQDGFGIAGVRVQVKPGERQVVRIKRLNTAERIYRITGEGIYRDSVLLGYSVPIAEPVNNAGVVGQDSTLAVPYNGQIHWIWGDTGLTRYPLGLFRAAGAVSDLPSSGGLAPSAGVDLHYFVDDNGLARNTCPLDQNEPGVVWLDGAVVVPDQSGRDRFVAHYSRRKSLGEQLEHGIVVWNDDAELFEPVARLADAEKWRHIAGQPVLWRDGNADYVVFGVTFHNIRVPATFEALVDPARYEAWSCSAGGPDAAPERDEQGRLRFSWRGDRGPLTAEDEQHWLKAGAIAVDEAVYHPADVESDKRITLHRGSIRYNAHRDRWIMIASEYGGASSFLGEVWYSEAPSPLGPWQRAKKVVTHDKYTFYNPVHHAFFDEDGGRVIYFEGTYASTFSGNPVATPRYDYNQVMYRLDLDDEALAPVH